MKKILLLSGLLIANAFAVVPIPYGNQIFGITNSNGTLLVAGDNDIIFSKSATDSSWHNVSSHWNINWRSIASSTDGYVVVGGHGALAYAKTTAAGTLAWNKITVSGTSGATSYTKLISGPDSNSQQHFLAIGDAPAADQQRGKVLYQAATNNITNWSRVATNIVDLDNNPNIVDVAAGNKQFMALDGKGYAWISNDAVKWTKINQQICDTSQFAKPQVIGGGSAFYVLCVKPGRNNPVTLNVYSYTHRSFDSNPLLLEANYDQNTSFTMAFSDIRNDLVILENKNGYVTNYITGYEEDEYPIEGGTTYKDSLANYNIETRIAGTAYKDAAVLEPLMFIGNNNKILRLHLGYLRVGIDSYN